MKCPDCGWPYVNQHVTRTRTFRRCLRVTCNWQQTVPVLRRKRAHRELPGGDTERLRTVLTWAKELGW